MKKIFVGALLAVAASWSAAQAPQPAPAADLAQLRELLAVAGTEKQYEQMMSIMMSSVRSGFNQGFANALKDKQIDPGKRERAQAIADRHFDELQKDLMAEIRRLMPYEKLVNEVYAPLYLNAFTRAEIQEAIAFYKSPAGRKFVSAAPQLMADASQAINRRYMPEMVRSFSGQMEARMKRVVDELSKL